MIYTITANPAIDYVLHLDHMRLGAVNRVPQADLLAGGKGINVSQILNQLNVANTALGFVGGDVGKILEKQLVTKAINDHFTRIAAQTRINVKIKAGEETELNAAGPHITAAEKAAFFQELAAIQQGDVVVISGSLPASLDKDFYNEIITRVQHVGADFAIDTTGAQLLESLPKHPLVVKPNHHELADLFHMTFKDDADLIAHGQDLLAKGAQHVLVSMAGAGAYLITPDHVYHSAAPKGTVKNSVGAGDSMLAGFVGTFTQHRDPVEAFRYGLACGSATAFSEDIADRAAIDALLPAIQITTVN